MKNLFCLSVTITLLALFNSNALGATKTSAKSGPFGFPSTWTDGIAPAPGDNIVIEGGHHVGGATGVINNLTLNGTLSYSGLTATGEVRIGVSGVMTNLHGGFQLSLKGPKISNNGIINGQTRINSDSTQEISGAGFWNGGGELSGAGEKTIEHMNVATGLWSVLSVVTVDRTWTFTGGSASKQSAGTVRGSGNVVFDKPGRLTSDESTGNLWTTTITIAAHVAITSSSSVSAPIFIRDEAVLSVTLKQVFEAKSEFIVLSGGKVVGEAVRLSGENISNNGEINPGTLSFNRAGNQVISGDGSWQANGTTIAGSGEKSLANSMTMSPGGLVINSTLNINGHTLTINGGAFQKNQTGTVTGPGKIIFQGDGSLASDESTGNRFTAPVEINTGRRVVSASSGISAPITVEAGAALGITAHATLNARDDLTLKTGSSLDGQTLAFSGENFINDGTVNPVNVVFTREGKQTISGSGAWRSPNGIELNGSGVKLLTSDVTMQTGLLNVNSILDIGGKTLTFVNGAFNKQLPGSVTGTGTVKFMGNGTLNSFVGNGNLFTVPIDIVTGTRGPVASSGFDSPITVRSGATLNISAHVTMNAKGDLTVERDAKVMGQTLHFHGPNFINHGTVAPIVTVFKSGSHALSGNGSFGNTVDMASESSTVLQGTQQFNALRVLSGSSLDITNSTIKIALNFNNSGTVKTDGSTIEYNRSNGDQTLLTNITYHNLVIDNPQQVFLHSPETIGNILRLQQGIFEIGANRLVMFNCAQIVRAGGTLNGTPVCVNDATFIDNRDASRL
ncbi:MAG TPA: hypothetical protein VJT15_26855 [Pyrinomonadaceae bacterium]|nr:hypothetical protein [Pyrinomonadaceae bacterium]